MPDQIVKHPATAPPGILGILLIALFLGSFLGAVFHVVSADHDASLCPVCTWFQIHGWILPGVFFLVFCPSPDLVVELRGRSFSVFYCYPRNRSPPLI